MIDTNMVKVSVISIPRGQDTYTLKAAVYLLRPSSIFYYARISFTIILIATLFTVSLLAYLFFTESKTLAASVKRDAESDEGETKNTADVDSISESENAETLHSIIEESSKTEDENNGAQNERETKTENVAATAINTAADKNIRLPSNDTASNSAIDASSLAMAENAPHRDAPEPQMEETSIDEEHGVSESGEKMAEPKKDFFSPVTGFGWERNFQLRLENELVRAASSEADLSLFIIKIAGLHFTDEVAEKICTCLLEEFQFRDMIFEFGEDGFAVIKTDTTILKAEEIAGTLHSRITKIIEAAALSCFIGISSRSTRMLSADRLILEAEEALNRSLDDPSSPITAFHVDIDKYRDFLKNN